MDFCKDRSWMRRRTASPQIGTSLEFQAGVVAFLDFAYSHKDYVYDNKIRCPCKKCKLNTYEDRDLVEYHLKSKGFMDKYEEYWWAHGQPVGRYTASVRNQDNTVYRMNEMIPSYSCNIRNKSPRQYMAQREAQSEGGSINWKDMYLSLSARIYENYEKLMGEKYPEEVQRPSFDQELWNRAWASTMKKDYVKEIDLKQSRPTSFPCSSESSASSTATSAKPSSQQTAQDFVKAICENQSLLLQLKEHIMSTLTPKEIGDVVAKTAKSHASNAQISVDASHGSVDASHGSSQVSAVAVPPAPKRQRQEPSSET